METHKQQKEAESRFLYFEPRFNHTWVKNPLKKPLCYIGLGGSGGRILDSARIGTNQALCIHIDQLASSHKHPKVLFVPFALPVNVGWLSPVDFLGRTDFSVSHILPLFNCDTKYVIFCGLGGYTGSFLTQFLTLWLTDQGIDFQVICSFPFQYEGHVRCEMAFLVYQHLKHIEHFNYYSLEMLCENYPKNDAVICFKVSNRAMIELNNSFFNVDSKTTRRKRNKQ